MANRDPHTGEKLTGAEGLRQVVVGAAIERIDLVLVSATRGEDDDRNHRPLAQATRDFETVEVGEAEVEQYEIRVVRGRLLQGHLAGRRVDDAVPMCAQGPAKEA